MRGPHIWHNWTFNFKPPDTDIFRAVLQVQRGSAGKDSNNCLLYLRDALYTTQVKPTDWWNKYGRSVYYLMMFDTTEKHLPENDLGRFEAQPEDVIPWLNQKLGLLEQSSSPERKKPAIDFLLKWNECTRIEENPRRN